MASTVFPLPVASTGPNAYAATVPASGTKYKLAQAFSTGAYSITTSPNTSQATVTFYDATTTQTDTTTVSGTVTYNLASAAIGAYVSIDTGTNVVVTITLVANALSTGVPSGTLDTITTTSTYNQTGLLYVLALGGGGGGGNPANGQNTAGGGGAAGYGVAKIVIANAATSVTIGAGGNAGGGAGGTTNFGNLVSAAGGAGGDGNGGSAVGGASGGNYTSNAGKNGGTTPIFAIPITNGTTGGGGSGGPAGAGVGVGGGSGIGTGGTGAIGNGVVTAANGYASGGGGGGGNSNTGVTSSGGAGRQGVVYVLRGI